MKKLFLIIAIFMLCACNQKPMEAISGSGVIGTYVTNDKNQITMILKSDGGIEIFVVDAKNGKEQIGGPGSNYKVMGNKIVISIQGGGTSSSELKDGSFETPLGVFHKK